MEPRTVPGLCGAWEEADGRAGPGWAPATPSPRLASLCPPRDPAWGQGRRGPWGSGDRNLGVSGAAAPSSSPSAGLAGFTAVHSVPFPGGCRAGGSAGRLPGEAMGVLMAVCVLGPWGGGLFAACAPPPAAPPALTFTPKPPGERGSPECRPPVRPCHRPRQSCCPGARGPLVGLRGGATLLTALLTAALSPAARLK